MRKFFTALVLIPLAILFIVFAVANRHLVTVSFDPFNAADPALAIKLPLFVVIIAMAIAGVVAGGAASWLRHRHWRRTSRRHEAEARQARAELADLRGAGLPRPGHDPQRLAALAPASGYLAGGRDKRGATL